MRLGFTICAVAAATLLGGCSVPPPGYGYYPAAPVAYGPGGPLPPVMYRAMENSAWTGSGEPIYVPSGARPGCLEYRGSTDTGGTDAGGSRRPLVRTICPAPDGSLRVVTGSTDTP